MTLLHFVGRGTSYRPYFGASGKRYLFGGKHHSKGYVLDSDAAVLLGLVENGKHLFEVVKPAKVIKPVEVVKPAEIKSEVEPEVIEAKPKRTRKKKAE